MRAPEKALAPDGQPARGPKKSRTAKFIDLWRKDGPGSAFCATLEYLGRKSLMAFFLRFASPGGISLLKAAGPFGARRRSRALALLGDTFAASNPVTGQFEILRGAGLPLAGKEMVFLAHQDPQHTVDDYVVHLGRHFKSLGKSVVLCTPCAIDSSDPRLDFADAIVRRQCEGSDLTSWKCGAAAFPDIFLAKEVTFCNDSVFGPVGSYGPVYEAMSTVDCDFWGLVAARDGLPYIPTRHLVFKASALENPAFAKFLDAIPASANSENSAAIERGLGIWLELAGLRPGVFAKFPFCGLADMTITLWAALVKYGCPIFSRELLRHPRGSRTLAPGWYEILERAGYPVNLILRHFYRLGLDISSSACYGRRGATCPPNIMTRQLAIRLPADGPGEADLGVIAHCYYEKGFALLEPYLANLPPSASIYISTDTEEKAAFLRGEAEKLGFGSLEVRVCPNAGWDMGPFLAGFADAIRSHGLILKVHAKMSTNQDRGFSGAWRNLLYESLMGSKDHVNRILALFGETPGLGILAPPTFQGIADASQKYNIRKLRQILAHFGVRLSMQDAIDFPVGGMFWARSSALAPLLDIGLGFDDFEKTDPAMRDGTLAHAVERSFFFSCHAASLDWGRVPPPPYTALAPVRPTDTEHIR